MDNVCYSGSKEIDITSVFYVQIKHRRISGGKPRRIKKKAGLQIKEKKKQAFENEQDLEEQK